MGPDRSSRPHAGEAPGRETSAGYRRDDAPEHDRAPGGRALALLDAAISRREALLGAGALGLSALLPGCGLGGEDDGQSGSSGTGTGSTAGATTADDTACVLTPEQTEGPYYIADSMIRSDITDGNAGVPLELRLRVQDADSCDPIKNATVEVWHADAQGVYSGFGEGASSRTFLRGGQRSDTDGNVVFRTVYPGWYQGRTTHIHVKVHVGGSEVHTGQLYFPDSTTASVAESVPYSSRGAPETDNSSDAIYAQGGESSTLTLSRDGDGYVGRLALGVRTA